MKPALLCLLMVMGGVAAPASRADVQAAVSPTRRDAAIVLEALRAARPGEVVALPPGIYSGVVISGFAGHVTLTGIQGAPVPVFTDLIVRTSHGITFRSIDFDASHTPVGQWGAEATIPFVVGGSSDIHFDHVTVHGSPAGSLANTVSGLMINSSSNVSVTDSDFSYLHNAFQHGGDDHLTISGNSFHNLWDDAIRGGGSNFVTIDFNHCYSNHPDLADPDHPDCIQFWTTNTKAPTHDIVISNNRYERGTGTATQFVFVGNELKIPYEKVKILGNAATGAQWNAIRIGVAHNVEISDNQVTSLCAPEGGRFFVARIMATGVDGLILRNNSAGAFLLQDNTDVVNEHNATTPCR